MLSENCGFLVGLTEKDERVEGTYVKRSISEEPLGEWHYEPDNKNPLITNDNN